MVISRCRSQSFGFFDTTLESTDTLPEPPFVCGWNDKHQQAVDVFDHPWPVEPGGNIIPGLLPATIYPCAAQLEVKKICYWPPLGR